MRAFNTWNQVQVVNEKLEAVGRCGVVGDTKGHKDDAVPVKLDGDDSETVFKNADLKAL
jgi:hypothetical protein